MMHPATRAEPPMPRSQQLRNAAAAAAAGIDAPLPPPPRALQPTLRRMGIDYGKFKTKLCRNYQMGLPCPFDTRCVFAHGEDQLARPGDALYDQVQSPLSAYGGVMMEFPMQQASSQVSDDEMAVFSPPTYETFLQTAMCTEPASPIESEPMTPQSPMRYRHDPYSVDCFVFKYY